MEEKQLVGETNNMGVTYERNKEDMVKELVTLEERDQKVIEGLKRQQSGGVWHPLHQYTYLYNKIYKNADHTLVTHVTLIR